MPVLSKPRTDKQQALALTVLRCGVTPRRLERADSPGKLRDLAWHTGVTMLDLEKVALRWGIQLP